MRDFKDLNIYQEAFKFAMELYELTKSFPSEEKYSLISQIRRSSRSICSCIGEAYRKRQYPKHFISKISDADMENAETQVWLEFALSCDFITVKDFEYYNEKSLKIGRMLNYMIRHPEKFSPKNSIFK